MKASELLEEAVSLPVEARVHLVDCLLQTLNAPDASHADVWTEVACQRLDELRSQKIVPIPGDVVFARIQQRYKK